MEEDRLSITEIMMDSELDSESEESTNTTEDKEVQN